MMRTPEVTHKTQTSMPPPQLRFVHQKVWGKVQVRFIAWTFIARSARSSLNPTSRSRSLVKSRIKRSVRKHAEKQAHTTFMTSHWLGKLCPRMFLNLVDRTHRFGQVQVMLNAQYFGVMAQTHPNWLKFNVRNGQRVDFAWAEFSRVECFWLGVEQREEQKDVQEAEACAGCRSFLTEWKTCFSLLFSPQNVKDTVK